MRLLGVEICEVKTFTLVNPNLYPVFQLYDLGDFVFFLQKYYILAC